MVLTPGAWSLSLKHSLPGVSIQCPVFLHSGWVRTPILGCPSILKSLKSLFNSQPLSSYFLPDLVNDHPGHRQLSSCLGPWREPLADFWGLFLQFSPLRTLWVPTPLAALNSGQFPPWGPCFSTQCNCCYMLGLHLTLWNLETTFPARKLGWIWGLPLVLPFSQGNSSALAQGLKSLISCLLFAFIVIYKEK